MRRFCLVTIGLLLTLTAYSQNGLPVIRGLPSALDWKEFRRGHPFHIQTIAVSEPDASGARTLIVSEPPPRVSLDSLRTVSPLLGSPRVETQAIGVDGWVK